MKQKIAYAFLISISLSFMTAQSHAENALDHYIQPVAQNALDGISTYFIMTDRFNNANLNNDYGIYPQTRMMSGVDKTDISFFHGGDFLGITEKLDYIKGLGFNAIWVSPPVKNYSMAFGSAAYHGYAGVDFTTTDSRFGSEKDFSTMVAEAHKRGIKIFVDVVVNHTADIISYKEGDYSYVETGQVPYKDSQGKKFSLTPNILKNFPRLSAAKSFPKTPLQNPTPENVKNPAFLRDLTNYHNRGDSTFSGESMLFGDFYGLDDVFTEKPQVVKGWIDTWSGWITRFNIDGMRIDTYRHVNDEFWAQFIPAIQKAAAAQGKTSFPIFGEIFEADPSVTAYYVKEVSAPSVLDFAFQNTISKFAAFGYNASGLADLFNADDYYTTKNFNANGLATFLGNHDMGRIGMIINKLNPVLSDEQLLERDALAHAMLFYLRGSPIVYYGDEKGLMGSPGDKGARQDLFSTQVVEWQNEKRIGSSPIGTRNSFTVTNPLEATLSNFQKIVRENPALKFGNQQTIYAVQDLFVVSRIYKNQEYVIAFNGGDSPVTTEVSPILGNQFKVIDSTPGFSYSDGSRITLTVPARGWAVLASEASHRLPTPHSVRLSLVDSGLGNPTWLELAATVSNSDYAEVTFLVRVNGKVWTSLGTSNRQTFTTKKIPGGRYRVYLPTLKYPRGAKIDCAAVAQTFDGKISTSNIVTLTNSR